MFMHSILNVKDTIIFTSTIYYITMKNQLQNDEVQCFIYNNNRFLTNKILFSLIIDKTQFQQGRENIHYTYIYSFKEYILYSHAVN